MLEEIKNFIWNNFTLIWAILGTAGTAYGFIVNRRDKDLEVMPEFELKSLGYSMNGRKFRLVNKTKLMVMVIKIKTKTPHLIDMHASTPLNWYLEENDNNFYVQVRERTGDLKFSLIFENKLRRKYIQTVTFISGTKPAVNDQYFISRAKRYRWIK